MVSCQSLAKGTFGIGAQKTKCRLNVRSDICGRHLLATDRGRVKALRFRAGGGIVRV